MQYKVSVGVYTSDGKGVIVDYFIASKYCASSQNALGGQEIK